MFPLPFLTPLLVITIYIYKGQTCDIFTDLKPHHAITGTILDTRLLLYTRANATCGKLLSHSNMSDNPDFDLSRQTTFIIHGYRPTGSPPGWLGLFTKLLLTRADMNVVVVDWNRGATSINYIRVARNTRQVAENLTAFITNMQGHGASVHSMHMIGVSLGAHISGFVGANLNGQIGRITEGFWDDCSRLGAGICRLVVADFNFKINFKLCNLLMLSALDPAGPQFNDASPENRLDPTDALFVDVVHTDMDALGYRKPIGHIDFYPNGGADQTGCPRTILSGSAYFKCDHQRSVYLFIESVTPTFSSKAYPCSSYIDFLDGLCMECDNFSAAGCPIFGYNVIHWKNTLVNLSETKAFFTTNKASPFFKSSYSLDIVIWNQDIHLGYMTIKLYGANQEAIATINHKASQFKKYTQTQMLAQFDKHIQSVEKVSLIFSSGNVLKPKYKLRILRMRLTDLEQKHRPLCRYDIVLLENKEASFKPISCEDSNF